MSKQTLGSRKFSNQALEARHLLLHYTVTRKFHRNRLLLRSVFRGVFPPGELGSLPVPMP